MAIVPPYTPNNTVIDATDIYGNSLYSPKKNVHALDTFEVLNGGLTKANYKGVDGSISAEKLDLGNMAQGYYFGFDRTDFCYAEQLQDDLVALNGKNLIRHRIVHASLSFNVFIPWDASVVMFGYQGTFQQDATKFASPTFASTDEFWDLVIQLSEEVELDASVLPPNPSLYTYQRLDYGRFANEDAGTCNGESPLHAEERFRHVSKSQMLYNVSKGYQRVSLTVGSYIANNDPRKAKLKTPNGSVWLIALR